MLKVGWYSLLKYCAYCKSFEACTWIQYRRLKTAVCLYHKHLCSSAKLINSMPKFTHVCTCTCNYMYMYMHMHMIDPTHYTKDICTSLSTDAHAHTCIMYTVLHHQKFPWHVIKLSRFFFIHGSAYTYYTHTLYTAYHGQNFSLPIGSQPFCLCSKGHKVTVLLLETNTHVV